MTFTKEQIEAALKRRGVKYKYDDNIDPYCRGFELISTPVYKVGDKVIRLIGMNMGKTFVIRTHDAPSSYETTGGIFNEGLMMPLEWMKPNREIPWL